MRCDRCGEEKHEYAFKPGGNLCKDCRQLYALMKKGQAIRRKRRTKKRRYRNG